MRALVLVACAAAGCSNDYADASGDYTVTVTNRDNACNFGNWTPGDSAAASVTLSQNRNNVLAQVTGLGALVLEASIGGHAFTGKIEGDDLALNLFGTRTSSSGNCTYTFNGEIHATLDGDTLTGQLDYVSATNGNSDCAAIAGCKSFQEFTGTRPPRVVNSVTPGPDVSARSAPPTAR